MSTILVIGSGVMGSSITSYCLSYGINVSVFVRNEEKEKTLLHDVSLAIKTFNRRNPSQFTLQESMERLSVFTTLSDCFKNFNYDFIIETINEDIHSKINLIKEVNKFVLNNTIFATNTSSLSVTELSSAYKYPDKLIGMHFFNPVSQMELVEVASGLMTSTDTANAALTFIDFINKKSVSVADSTGFIVNRLLIPMINEAVVLLENNIASKEEIDKAIKLGAHHPLGPLSLADLIGVDVCLSIMKSLQQTTKNDKYQPAKLMIKMVEDGLLGKKTKCGFYKYR